MGLCRTYLFVYSNRLIKKYSNGYNIYNMKYKVSREAIWYGFVTGRQLRWPSVRHIILYYDDARRRKLCTWCSFFYLGIHIGFLVFKSQEVTFFCVQNVFSRFYRIIRCLPSSLKISFNKPPANRQFIFYFHPFFFLFRFTPIALSSSSHSRSIYLLLIKG